MSLQISTDKHLIGPWVCERIGGMFIPEECAAIGLLRDGKIAGGVMFNNYMRASVCMHAAGEGRRWLSRDSLHVYFDYPFRQLGVGKIIAPVDEENEVSCRFVEHIGFRLETKIGGAARSGRDLLLYTMTKDQCRWLNMSPAPTIANVANH